MFGWQWFISVLSSLVVALLGRWLYDRWFAKPSVESAHATSVTTVISVQQIRIQQTGPTKQGSDSDDSEKVAFGVALVLMALATALLRDHRTTVALAISSTCLVLGSACVGTRRLSRFDDHYQDVLVAFLSVGLVVASAVLYFQPRSGDGANAYLEAGALITWAVAELILLCHLLVLGVWRNATRGGRGALWLIRKTDLLPPSSRWLPVAGMIMVILGFVLRYWPAPATI